MSSAEPQAKPAFDLAPGEQVLVRIHTGEFACMDLPAHAYENLLVLSTGCQPNRVEEGLRRRGANPAEIGLIPITGATVRYDGPLWVANRVGPGDLTGISIAFSEAMRYVSADGWVCFDTVSVLAMYADDRALYQLLQSMVEGVRDRGARGVYAFVEDALSPESYQQFRTLFDREIEYGRP
jgi:hypothetical protein